MKLAFVLPFTIALHLAYTGARVTLSLFALHLQASPFTVGILLSLLARLPMFVSVAVGRVIEVNHPIRTYPLDYDRKCLTR